MELHFYKWKQSVNQEPLPLLFFLHGMGGTGQIWRPIAAALEESFLCIAPDQRGHGQSRPVPPEEAHRFHAEDYARDLHSLLDQLIRDENPSQVLLIGHSMGVRSALATLISISRSQDPIWTRISGLISVDIGFQSQWGGGIGEPLAEFLQNLPKTFDDRETMRRYLFQNCPDPAIAQYLSAVAKKNSTEQWSFPFDHEALIETIHQANDAPIELWVRELCDHKLKILALRGEHSKVWLKPDYELARNKFKSPTLQFEEWKDCGHGIPFEQRQRFVERIIQFTKDTRPQS